MLKFCLYCILWRASSIKLGNSKFISWNATALLWDRVVGSAMAFGTYGTPWHHDTTPWHHDVIMHMRGSLTSPMEKLLDDTCMLCRSWDRITQPAVEGTCAGQLYPSCSLFIDILPIPIQCLWQQILWYAAISPSLELQRLVYILQLGAPAQIVDCPSQVGAG